LQRWQLLFSKYDEDGDGSISLAELKQLILSESYTRDIPGHAEKQILKRADEDEDGYLDYQEFLKMVCNDFMECFTLVANRSAGILMTSLTA
jgi:Ca2+-binding EF-hand superfamily protein